MNENILKLGCTNFGNKHGSTLIFLPGWATDHHIFANLQEYFPNYNIVCVDMPGYGKSRQHKNFAEDIKKTAQLLLNTLPYNCTLISWSLSTLAAILACAYDKNHKIKRFITLCGTPRFPCDPLWPGFDYKYILKSFSLFDNGDPKRNIRLFFLLQTQGNLLSAEQKKFLLDSFNKMGDVDVDVLKTGLYFMSHCDLRAAFSSLAIPCLHIFGKKDRLVKPALSKKFEILPNRKCLIFENSAHTPFLTEPELLKEHIEMFIENNP